MALVFLAYYCGSVILTTFIRYRLVRRDGPAEERRSNPMLEVRIQLLRSAQQKLSCEAGYAEMRHYLPW